MREFFGRIWILVRPYRVRLILGLICASLYALTNSALVIVIRWVVDAVFPASEKLASAQSLKSVPAFIRPLLDNITSRLPAINSPSSKAGVVAVIATIPLIMLARVLFDYLNIYLMNWAAIRAITDLRVRLFDHLLNLSSSFFSQARTGDLISRITSDTQVLYGTIGGSFAFMVKEPLTILGLLAVLFTQERRLTLVSLVVLPICLVPIIIYGRKVRKSAKAVQTHLSDLTSLMHESFTGNRIIKAYNLEETAVGQFKETAARYVSQTMRVLRANEIPSHITEFLGAVGVALVLVYAVFLADQTSTSGDFMSFILAIVMMYQPIKTLVKLHNQLQQARFASQRIFELLDIANAVVDPPKPEALDARNADIHFENVDFDYNEKPLLRNFNLTVKAGQLVALVGSSGSGKTTLTNLLLRFYDPQRGSVRIGSTDIRHVRIRDLRQQIALVAQETILFNDTIRHNIAVGRPGATDAEIETAAKHAYAHEFIGQQERAYETIVGEKGIAVSGGQRQRIAIARAILKDAPILVLDEATNALDAESERAVQAALEGLMQGRTTICIAHRLSTIQKADLIVVLAEGRIAESGTHAELIQMGGVYSKLYELQFDRATA
jgi:subfamily B ATP-binding cassette protein MsbA